MKPKAIILSGDILSSPHAKTTHGLIRTSDKYEIAGVLDKEHAGRDAGEVLDGRHRNIPVFANLQEAIKEHTDIKYAIIGVATHGGIIPKAMEGQLMDILDHGISIVNGLHTYLSEIPQYVDKAKEKGLELIDVRKPKKKEDLAFWTGDIFKVNCPIIAVLGTDCALGKRTTTRILVDALKEAGIKAEMIYTGQTGKLQNDGYGFVFDSTLNDFVSGELEHAIVSCYKNRQPDVILLEGQASLFNPSGPCGSEYLISANAKHVILQHAPARTYYEGWEHLKLPIPPVEKTKQLIEIYGSEIIGICLNGCIEEGPETVDKAKMEAFKSDYREQFGVPVVDPINDKLETLVTNIKTVIEGAKK